MKKLSKLYSIAKEFVKEYESNIKGIEVIDPKQISLLSQMDEMSIPNSEDILWIAECTGISKEQVDGLSERKVINNERGLTITSVQGKHYSNADIKCLLDCLKFFPEHLHPKKQESWLSVIDKLFRIDKVPYDEIVRITELARKDPFWSKNFLSLTKLRKKKDEVMYIVSFSEKFKAKEKTINRQTQSVIESNLKGWGEN